MACCLMAPSHYLNQCWLLISEVLSNFKVSVQATILYDEFEKYANELNCPYITLSHGKYLMMIKSWLLQNIEVAYSHTLWCHYNANLVPNPHNRHDIACLWGRSMGWVQGSPFLKIITCLTSRILKFFDLLIWNKEEKSVQIHLPDW